MPDVNPAALRKRHLAAERWERCRAAWFSRCGNKAESTKRMYAAKDHMKAANYAEINMKRAQWS